MHGAELTKICHHRLLSSSAGVLSVHTIVSLFVKIHGILADLRRGCSSVVEHSTADREVPGSNPGAPLGYGLELIFLDYYLSFFFNAKTLKTCTAWESNPGLKNGNLE